MNDYIVDAFTQTEDKVNLEVDNLNVECITSKNNNFNVDSEGNLTVKSVSAEQGMMSQTTIRDFIYPVGSIYMSINSTSPATLFGGIWEQIQDKFLLACGSVYSNNTTGGSISHVHTTQYHTLTVDEMPSHDHCSPFITNGIPDTGNVDIAWPRYTGGTKEFWADTGFTGGNLPHSHGDTGSASNMPPYLAVYVWKRIA